MKLEDVLLTEDEIVHLSYDYSPSEDDRATEIIKAIKASNKAQCLKLLDVLMADEEKGNYWFMHDIDIDDLHRKDCCAMCKELRKLRELFEEG